VIVTNITIQLVFTTIYRIMVAKRINVKIYSDFKYLWGQSNFGLLWQWRLTAGYRNRKLHDQLNDTKLLKECSGHVISWLTVKQQKVPAAHMAYIRKVSCSSLFRPTGRPDWDFRVFLQPFEVIHRQEKLMTASFICHPSNRRHI
jgi:hypothetical protein